VLSGLSKALRKKILADPLAMLASFCIDLTDEQINGIRQLHAQYMRQKREQRQSKELGKRISRQIGEQKSAGNPVEDLKAAMQKECSRLATIDQQIEQIAESILAFFPAAGETNKPDRHSESTTADRFYPASEVSIDMISIHLLEDGQEEWDNYVAINPAASIYHRSDWKGLIHDVFGHDGLYLYARDDAGKIVGILPLVRLKSLFFGDFMVSMPYFNYGGAIADHPSIEQKLMDAANARAADLGVAHVEYRDDFQRTGLPARTDKVSMILQLPDSGEELWRKFPSKLRAQIRRPYREQPEIMSGGEEYLDDFYTVFARNMRDLGTPVYGKSFFLNILQCFPENCSIVVITLSGRPVAAGFLLGHRDTLEIPWASTVRDANHLSINMLLYWEVLKFAIDKKYSQFDFGRSSRDAGTYRFKQQWGARPRQLYWHYWLKSGEELPSLNPDNPKFALAINIWKRLPLAICNLLGPSVVGNLP
jgi:FemAB-related protein (PEP-CTERM system-associated)